MNKVIEVVESFNEYVKNVIPGALSIASLLRNSESNKALQLILHFSEGVDWLNNAGSLLRENGVEVTLELEAINEFLIEINNGLEVQDFVLVADIFEYEIAPFFERIGQIEIIKQ